MRQHYFLEKFRAVCGMIGERVTAGAQLVRHTQHFVRSVAVLTLLFVAPLGIAATPLPEILDGKLINCNTPTIGGGVNRNDNNCYQTELTYSGRSLRDLHRRIYDLASYEERRHLREIEANWRRLRDTQCDIIANTETGVSNRLAINRFCKAILTQMRLNEVERLNQQILLRTGQ